MSFVVDAIKDIGRWIDDEIWEPIKDVGSWLDDEIFQPVIKFAEAQIQAIIDDPVKAILKAVAVMTGQAAWAIPLIEGADAIDEGGNIGDALKAAAVSYVSMQAGDIAGEFAAGVGESVGSVISNEAVSAFVTEAVTAGTKEAIGAVITGQDPLDAFLSGGMSVGVGRVLGEVNARTGGALDKLEELGGFREDDPNTPDINESQSVGSIVRDLVQQGVSDQLATGEINERRMAGIISSAVVTTQVVSDLVGDYVGDDNALFNTKMLTISVQNALNVAMTEGDVSEAFMISLARQIGSSSIKALNEGTFQQEFGDAWDRVTGKFATLNDQGLLVEGAVDAHTAVVDEINDIAQQIKEGSEELARLTDIPTRLLQGSDGRTRMSRSEQEALEYAEDVRDDYQRQFESLVTNELAPRLEVLNPLYDSTAVDYQTAVDNYTETYATLAESTQELNEALAPAFAGINQATVENISPDFDAEFYAEQNGITKEEAYDHYLTQGLFSNLPSNQTTLTAQNSAAVNNVINAAAKAIGLDASQLTDAQRKLISEKLTTMAGSGSISDIPEQYTVQALLSAINNPDGTGEEFFSATQNADGSYNYEYSSTSSTFGRAEGVTNADIRDGNAELVIDPDTGQRVWTNVSTEPHWNEHLGNILQTDSETGEQFYMDADGNRMNVLDVPDVDINAVNAANPNAGDGSGNETLQDLAENDPQAFTDVVNDNNLSNPDTGSTAADWFLQALADGATYLQGDEDTAPASEAAQNAYANGIRATAGIIEAFNGFATAFGSDPAGTAAGKFAADMAKIGEGANTAGYQEAVGGMREFQKSLQTRDDPNTPIVYDENGEYVSGDESKKSLWEGAQGIFKTAGNHPAAFFGEYISVEFMQEAAPLLVGSLATILARGAAKVLGSGLTKELAEEAAQVIGKKAGLTAAAATDVAEAWAGTAGGAYEQGHATFMKMAGKEADLLELSGPARDAFLAAQDTKAREYALNLAINSGNVAGVMAIGSLAVGGLALERLFINGKPPVEFEGLYNEIAKRLSEGATITVKEGLTEAFEEGAATGYTSGQLSLIDPDIDVMGDVGAAAALGGIVGGTISGGIYSISSTGDFVSDLLISNNPDALELLNNSENYSQEELNYQLNNFLGDPQAATDAMNFLYDEVYTSTAEAVDALESIGLPYTPEDVTNTTGSTPDADLDDELASYWAMTYGTDNDTDGDGILNSEDSNPDSPYTDTGTDPVDDTGTDPVDDTGTDPSNTTEQDAYVNTLNQWVADILGPYGAGLVYSYDPVTDTYSGVGSSGGTINVPDVAPIAAADFISNFQHVWDNPIYADILEAEILAAEAEAEASAEAEQAEADRIAAEEAAAAQAEADRIAAEEAAAAQAEAERLAAEAAAAQAEADRLAAEAAEAATQAEAERLAAEAAAAQAEADRLAAEAEAAAQAEADRIAAEAQAEADRLAAEAAEAATEAEAERLAQEAAAAQAEADRLAAEAEAQAQAEAERLAEIAAQAEADRLAAEEADRLAAEEEAERLAQEEADRLAAEEEAARVAEEARLAQEEADRLAEEARLADIADREAAQEAARLAAEEAARLAEEAAVARDAIASGERDAIADRVGTRAVEDDPNTEEDESAEATGIYKEIEDLLAQGDSIEEAIAKVAGDLGETEEAILTALGATEDELRREFETGLADVADRVGTRAVEDDPNTEEDESAEATGIYKEIEDLLAQGNSIEEAIAKVAGDLGETEETILTALGTTEDNLRNEFETGFEDVATKLGDMETDILYKMKEYQDQNLTADEALSKAIDDVSTDLGKTKEEILTELGETEASLITRFDEGMADLGLEIDNVANFVGKPASEVTAIDRDFYADYLAQQEVLSEVDPTSSVPTDQQLQYDVNNDGVIDAADQALVQQAFEGKDVTLGGKFESTGLYAYNDAIAAQQKLEAEQQFKEEQELEQQRQFELQTQIDQNQRLNKFDDEIRRVAEMQAAQPTVATTKKMGLAQIGPQYGFDTIFANKQQEQAYGTPFGGYGPSSSPLGQSPFGVRKASGGIIKDSTDRLLKIIGED